MARLLLKKKAEIIAEYYIKKQSISIGSSSDNDIYVSEQSISTHHCEIYQENNLFFIKDNTSAFGTFVGKERIAIKTLSFGDHIFIGNSPYSCVFLPEEEDAVEDTLMLSRMYTLIGIQGKFVGKKFEIIEGEVRIGRDEDYNDIVLPGSIDPSISRRHSTIHHEAGRYSISDRRSRNRTFVNQTEIGENDTIQLNPGDEIVIGHTIFRFCTFMKEDFSHPKKSSIFMERMKFPFFHGASMVLGLCALGFLFLSIRSFLIIRDAPDVPAAEKSSWSPEVLQSDPRSQQLLEYDVTLSPAVGNILGLKTLDIVFAFPHGKIYLWDGIEGRLGWESPVDLATSINSSPVLFDFNHDGAKDIIITAGDSRIYIIDGISGKLLYKSPLLGGTLSGEPAVGDINRDGIEDIVACSEEGTVHVIYSPLVAAELKQVKISGEILAPPVIYRDVIETIFIITSTAGKLYLYNGSTLEFKTIDTVESINKFTGSHLPINEITSCPAIADIDGDGEPEIVVFSNQYYVCALNVTTQDMEWLYHIDPPSIKEPPRRFSSPVLTDLNGDTLPDVVVTSPNGRVFALNGQTGDLLWEYNAGDWNRIISSPALIDLDKDDVFDIIFGGEDGSVYALSGSTQLDPDADRLFFKIKGDGEPITSTPCIADFDRDGYADILISFSNSMLRMYRTNNRVFKGMVHFPMKHFNAAQTGHFVFPQYKRIVFIKIIVSLLALMLIASAQYTVRKRMIKNKPEIIIL